MKLKPVKPLSAFSAPDEFERLYVRPKEGRTLVVGSYITEGKPDRRARYADAVGVDMRDGPGVDVVRNLEDEDEFLIPHMRGLFDHIECLSVLEHSRKPWRLAENLQQLMKHGATLHVSVPFVWAPHSYPQDFWRMTVEALPELFPLITWEKLTYGSYCLDADVRAQKVKIADGWNCFPRTETFGFGGKR